MVAHGPRTDVAGRDVRHDDLQALARLVGSGYRAVGHRLEPEATVARGEFTLRQVRPGLLVHASDAHHDRTLTTHLVKDRSLNFSVVVRGGWQGTLGGMPLACGGQQPQAMSFVLAEADVWRKQVLRGGHARMVNVMVSPEWLEASGLHDSDHDAVAIQRLARRHRWTGQWRPSGRTVALAEQILSGSRYAGSLRTLHLESRAIEIIVEALSLLIDQPKIPPRLQRATYRRMHLVRERLDAVEGDIPTLSALARDAGVSVRTLQREFALVHGISVLDYARLRRLDVARELLECQEATIAQAAHRAGYAYAANFATAFKRRFGLSPSQVRVRA